MIVINSFVTCKDIIEKTHPRSLLILNISDIIKLINDKNFSVSVQVSDELNNKGIKSVILEWRDPLKYRWQEVAMEPDTNRKMGWYIVPSTLKAVSYTHLTLPTICSV